MVGRAAQRLWVLTCILSWKDLKHNKTEMIMLVQLVTLQINFVSRYQRVFYDVLLDGKVRRQLKGLNF